MRLRTKLIAVLVSGLLVIYLVAAVFQHYRSQASIQRFAQESTRGEEGRQWTWVERLHSSIQLPLMEAMATGEMDRFNKLLGQSAAIPGLLELTLADEDGQVARSTVASRVHQHIDAELRSRLLKETTTLKLRTEDSFDIHVPIPVAPSCIECHPTWTAGNLCGVMSLRFSDQGLEEEKAAWAEFAANVGRSTLSSSVVTGLGLFATTGLLLGIVVQSMVAKPIRLLAGSLMEGSNQTAAAAGLVAAGSRSLADGAIEQAASLQEGSDSLRQMSELTRRNVQAVAQVRDLGSQARLAGDAAARDMQAMAEAMDAIKTSSDQIAKIVKTIDEIAFQTSILALNAAVEAARSGEAGAGFAVVASEVRNLAHRSAQAAKETAAKIEDSVRKCAHGVEITDQVARSIRDIVERSRDVDRLAGELASASREQDAGIHRVDETVRRVDEITQGNAATAEESASAAEELTAQAQSLRSTVNILVQLVDGNESSTLRDAIPMTSASGSHPRAQTPAAGPRPVGGPLRSATQPAVPRSQNGQSSIELADSREPIDLDCLKS